uniref:Phorbol-ester/DAG-type domain-containing protein n=1 Tax=Amphimedon queenslandica TaxID=400682 RepID=A0A1X7SS19_AMPQE
MHVFYPVDLKISQKKCYICHDRIWKQAWKCKRCKIVTHLKCTNYCKKMVPCHKEGGEEVEENVSLNVDESSNATVRYTTDQEWALLEREEEEKEDYARERTILEEEKEESYSHSRMLYRSVSEGLVTNQDGNGAILESIDTGGQDVTPPESDNSSTDDEHKDLESLTNDATCVSHETESRDKEEDETSSELLLEGYTDEQKELIRKINMAQNSLDLLATQKRELTSSSETSMTQEQKEYLLVMINQ